MVEVEPTDTRGGGSEGHVSHPKTSTKGKIDITEYIPEFVSPKTYCFPMFKAAVTSELKVAMLLATLLWLIKDCTVPPG